MDAIKKEERTFTKKVKGLPNTFTFLTLKDVEKVLQKYLKRT